MKDYLDLIFGANPFYWYMAAFTFAFIGQFLLWAWFTFRAVKRNPETPNKFSWSYWWENNAKDKAVRVLVVCAVIFLGLRFASDWFNTLPTMAYAFGVGIGIDSLIGFIKNLAKPKTGI